MNPAAKAEMRRKAREEARIFRDRAIRALELIDADVPSPRTDWERHALRHKDDAGFRDLLERQANYEIREEDGDDD